MAEKKGNEKKENTKKKNKTSRPKRRFRVNKKIEGKTGTIFIGHEDPFLYFPDMMSYFSRDEIEKVHLKHYASRGPQKRDIPPSVELCRTSNL